MNPNDDYSTKEKAIFASIGLPPILFDGERALPAPSLYRMAVDLVFCENQQGPAVESLRRCCNALNRCKIYRATPEWDAMIEL